MSADRATVALTLSVAGLALQLYGNALPSLAEVCQHAPGDPAISTAVALATGQAAVVVAVVGLALQSHEVLLVGGTAVLVSLVAYLHAARTQG